MINDDGWCLRFIYVTVLSGYIVLSRCLIKLPKSVVLLTVLITFFLKTKEYLNTIEQYRKMFKSKDLFQ